VLGALIERPMHPYEVSTTLRARGKEESIKINYGSLYSVVGTLAKRGLVRARETEREGRLPERTIYEITDAGREEFADWLAELVGTPVKEYTQFEAALSLLPGLPPAEVVRLLRDRRLSLRRHLAEDDATRAWAGEEGLPRLFQLEAEYRRELVRAELGYVDALIAELENESLDGIDLWRKIHDDPDFDPAAEIEARMTAT
jgi:DNA-binding PadR family transcriptional regulator